MSNRILITVDSSSNIPPEYRAKYNIERVLPLYINLGERSVPDNDSFTNNMILDYVAQSGKIPATSAATPSDYEHMFADYPYNEIFHVGIGSPFSCCYQNSRIAMQNFPNVKTVDTKTLSCGTALLAIYASGLVSEGKTLDEIEKLVYYKSKKLDISFIVNTLKFLHRSGRCSAVAALGANLLNIKPCIKVSPEGELNVVKKYRGNTSKFFAQYVKDMLTEPETIDDTAVFIVHTATSGAVWPKEMARLVAQIFPFKECILAEAGPTIFTHVGPDAMGIMFARK